MQRPRYKVLAQAPVRPRERAPRSPTLSQFTHAAEEPIAAEPIAVSPTGLDRRLLDEDAVRAVQRLQSFGYEAYLVGGCVRDLLLGHRPKDFDIATSARPAGVKRTFPRNCRIIGRRFKLAHLHFQGNTKILEVSTFRRAPEQGEGEDEDLLITRDNEFGNATEDAVRRDFTINALFYDPIRDELIDHAGGLADLERRIVRTIGDPLVRFREDPVRILRAVKFAGRLDLAIDGATADAMERVAPDLVRAAPPRVLEEILRLLRGGHALDAFLRLRNFGAIAAIMPTVQDYLDRADRAERIRFWRTLEALDGRAAQAARNPGAAWPPSNGVLLGAVFHRPVQWAAAARPERSPTGIAEEMISPFATTYRLPKRDTGCLKRICAVQHRFRESDAQQRFRAEAFLRDPYFPEALELFAMSAAGEAIDTAEVDAWRRRDRGFAGRRNLEFDDADVIGDRATPAGQPTPYERPSHEADDRDRRRKRKKRRRDRHDEVAPHDRREAAPERRDVPVERQRSESPAAASSGQPARERGQDRKRNKKRRDRDRPREAAQVETIEPEAIDLTAFDIELDPKRVPTFGTIVEGGAARKRRRVPTGEDDYRPPPPPGSDFSPPPPPAPGHTPDTFGDW